MNRKLAIKGHTSRGKEVIKILEMMGGKNRYNLDGNGRYAYYVIEGWPKEIRAGEYIFGDEGMYFLTLEEFLEKFPFKIGDKVMNCYGDSFTIKSMSWVEDCETMVYAFENTAIVLSAEDLKSTNAEFLVNKEKSEGTQFKEHDIVTIVSKDEHSKWICEYKSRTADQLLYYIGTYVITNNGYEKEGLMCNSNYDIYSEDTIRLATPEEVTLFRSLIRKNKMPCVLSELFEHIKTTPKEDLEREFEEIKEWSNVGPTIEEFRTFCECVNKKPKYPTTYEECCKVLGYDDRETYCVCHTGANERLFENLYRLKICRDAYWKIAGEEMGLDKPWEPDWNNISDKYTIYPVSGEIWLDKGQTINTILAFPTVEMRDTFYENFKDLIEQCKELL